MSRKTSGRLRVLGPCLLALLGALPACMPPHGPMEPGREEGLRNDATPPRGDTEKSGKSDTPGGGALPDGAGLPGDGWLPDASPAPPDAADGAGLDAGASAPAPAGDAGPGESGPPTGPDVAPEVPERDGGGGPDAPELGPVLDATPGPDTGRDAGQDTGPLPPPPICINEFMAANVLTTTDEEGRASDWIELYNPGDLDLPLEGFSLTDDLDDPWKHPLPEGLVVPAGGHLLLWADGHGERGPDHLGFRLSRDGGVIGLVYPGGAWADRVQYGRQEVDLSAARQGDGGARWGLLWTVTPGSPNPGGEGPVPPWEPGPGGPCPPEDPAAPPERVPVEHDVSRTVFTTDSIPHFGLVLGPAALQSLAAQPLSYVEGVLTFAGRDLWPVGIRIKGQQSLRPLAGKPSFKVKVNRYADGARFFGLTELTLNNMSADRTMLHERIAYFVARRMGVPASRCNHVELSVNGMRYGLYANVETVDRRMVRRWFLDDTGSLYEVGDVEFVAAQVPLFQHEAGPDDRAPLHALARALTLPYPDALPAVAGLVDLDQFRHFWATLAVIMQFDSLPFNAPPDDVHIYRDPRTGLFSFLPWGMDETFAWPDRNVLQVGSLLGQRVLEDPAWREALVREIWNVLAAVEELDVAGEIDRVAEAIWPAVQRDRRKEYGDEEVRAHQELMRQAVLNRRAALAAQLP